MNGHQPQPQPTLGDRLLERTIGVALRLMPAFTDGADGDQPFVCVRGAMLGVAQPWVQLSRCQFLECAGHGPSEQAAALQ